MKNRRIAGSPGCGKYFLMNYILLYTISKGLKVGITAILARHTVHLGGLHIHKLFGIVEKSDALIHRTTKIAIQHILSK